MDRDLAITTIKTTIAGPAKENDPAEYDIEAIVDEVREAAGGYDFQDLEPSTFWQIVEKHKR